MLNALLEQFQVLQILSLSIFSLDFSITNFLLINLLALITFLSLIYFNSSQCFIFNLGQNNIIYAGSTTCQTNMKMKNFNNKQIIKINAVNFKKTLRTTTFLKQTNDQIKFGFITQKRLFNTSSIHKKVVEYFSVFLEDEKRFYAYFKKKFPKSFKYLPVVKFITFLLMFVVLHVDYQTYLAAIPSNLEEIPSNLEEKFLIIAPVKFYSHYIFGFYIAVVIYEFVLSVYVTLNANSPVQNVLIQIGKNAAKAVAAGSLGAVGYSHAPVEPNAVSNFVHTQTPFGRGYDYEIGSFTLKGKGDLVSGALGNEDMVSAVQKHAPDSNIIDTNKLNKIMKDPEFKPKIHANTTTVEKAVLGVPIVDFSLPPLPTFPAPASSDVSNLNSLEVSDINNDNNYDNNNDNNYDNDTEESSTPVIKKSPLKKHQSEPLPQKSKSPDIQRRNTS